MKPFVVALSFALLPYAPSAIAQAAAVPPIAGTWEGTATVHGQQVPVDLRIRGNQAKLEAELWNGAENTPATSAVLTGDHLVVTFNYFAKTLDLTVKDGQISGTFGTKTTRYPVQLETKKSTVAAADAGPAATRGEWEVALNSAKGESAWQLHIGDAGREGVKAVIQRIDGDTGSLFGTWTGKEFRVSKFTAAGVALYTFTPQPDGTLLVSNLLRADVNEQQNLVARRPAQARAAALPPPTDPTQQTRMKDPSARFTFSAPDLNGKVVSNTDPQFDGKVVIVAIGGSWCPNCHDEAPMLESLYKQFHARGLEIVNLSFEDEGQLKDPERLRAFIARYGLTYTVLLEGNTDQLNEKVPQADNLNCWPTSFFLSRDGRVREVHAGFAGPANPPAHEALVKETTELVERLLDEPVPTQSAAR